MRKDQTLASENWCFLLYISKGKRQIFFVLSLYEDGFSFGFPIPSFGCGAVWFFGRLFSGFFWVGKVGLLSLNQHGVMLV
jgi:hypothetical protein